MQTMGSPGATAAAFLEGKPTAGLILGAPMIMGITFLFMYSWWVGMRRGWK